MQKWEDGHFKQCILNVAVRTLKIFVFNILTSYPRIRRNIGTHLAEQCNEACAQMF